MFQDDDFLPARPAKRENRMVLRIALMALAGCLLLISVLIIQARADQDAALYGLPTHPQPALHHHHLFQKQADHHINPGKS